MKNFGALSILSVVVIGAQRFKKEVLCPQKVLKGTPSWNSIYSPKRFPANFDCEIVIKSGVKGNKIELQFEGVKLADTEACKMQSIELYNDRVSEENLATRFCGKGAPDRFTSKGDTIIMKVSSNFAANAPKALYRALYEVKYRANMDWDGLKAKQDADKAEMFNKKHKSKRSGSGPMRPNGPGGKGKGGPPSMAKGNGRSIAGNLVKLKMAGPGGKGGKGGFPGGKGKGRSSTWNTPGKTNANDAMGLESLRDRQAKWEKGQKQLSTMHQTSLGLNGNMYTNKAGSTLLSDHKDGMQTLTWIGIGVGAAVGLTIVGVVVHTMASKFMKNDKDLQYPDRPKGAG